MIKKTVITKTGFAMSPLVKLIFAFAGILVIAAAVIVIKTTTTTSDISEQYDAIAVWQNNGEEGWDIAYAIYRQNSDDWIHQTDQEISYQGDANLIAKLPGDDNDPDISSARNKAMAVWSNMGLEGNQGADIILSQWSSKGWSKPARLFAIEGDDVDPTIYMPSSESALVVWVNRRGNERTLYYAEYINGEWSNPAKILFDTASEIAAPELGYTTVSNSRYLLVFTAQVGGIGSAYAGTYDKVNGWGVTKIDSGNVQAVTNENIPAAFRSSVAMQTDSREAIISWTGQDGAVWYLKIAPENPILEAKSIVNGINPVVLYALQGARGESTILFSAADKIVNITPVGGDLKQILSQGEKNASRVDATYFWEQGKKSAVVVWATKKEGESEIYFSALGRRNQKWSAPNRIDSKIFSGEDINPAVAPIIIQFNKESVVIKEDVKSVYEDSFCGNTILEKKFGEECEIGIACGNKDKICDWDYYTKKFGKKWAGWFSNCECLSPPDAVTPQPTSTPKTPQKEEPQTSKQKDAKTSTYGGFSCGFDQVVLKSALEPNQVSLQFLPDTSPVANGVIVFRGNYPSYRTSKMILFPESGITEDKNFVLVDFSDDDKVITMKGIDSASNFQLCVGVFTKGVSPEGGGFTPAPAH